MIPMIFRYHILFIQIVHNIYSIKKNPQNLSFFNDKFLPTICQTAMSTFFFLKDSFMIKRQNLLTYANIQNNHQDVTVLTIFFFFFFFFCDREYNSLSFSIEYLYPIFVSTLIVGMFLVMFILHLRYKYLTRLSLYSSQSIALRNYVHIQKHPYLQPFSSSKVALL